jgi:hypothetical protein
MDLYYIYMLKLSPKSRGRILIESIWTQKMYLFSRKVGFSSWKGDFSGRKADFSGENWKGTFSASILSLSIRTQLMFHQLFTYKVKINTHSMYCTSINSFYKCLQAFYFGPRKDENVKWSWIYHCGKVNFVLWAAFWNGRLCTVKSASLFHE